MDLPVGQLFVFGFDGFSLPKEAHALLKTHQAAGAILFKRNIDNLEQLVSLNTEIFNSCASHAYPALITVDQEGGRVARLNGICTPVPPMKGLQNPYQVGAMMAREISALGFHLDLAPVMDVDSNPQNTLIGDRSFSNNPQEVAEMGAAFIKGMQEAGLGACAKHFPGHGETILDSHLELPTLEISKERLAEVELVPFLSAIKAQVSSIMTGHLLVKALDPDFIATLSKNILTDLLRKKMGFNGLIISDDLDMKAISDHYTLEEQIRLGVLAGVDVFLICNNIQKSYQAIEIAQKLSQEDAFFRQQIEQSLKRIAHFKKTYIGHPAPADFAYAKSIIRSDPHVKLLQATI